MKKQGEKTTVITLFDYFTFSTFQKGRIILIDGMPRQEILGAQKVTGGVELSLPSGKLEIPLPPPPDMHHLIKGVLC